MFNGPCNLPFITFQKCTHIIGDVFLIECALVTICKDRDGYIVSRSDDISLIVFSVKHIIISLVANYLTIHTAWSFCDGSCGKFCLWFLLFKEGSSLLLSLLP